MSQLELLLTADAESPAHNTVAWDPATGTQVAAFRGGHAAAGTLCSLAGHSLAAAERGRPGVQLWRLARRDAVHQRLSTPGPVTALAADPAATWLALAVAERVFVHELSSGRLLAVLSRHYQTVTALRFTDDGSHFVSAADDGLAAVWPVAGCADPESARHGQPLHVWAHHSLPITGLHVGGGGPRARVLTCSRDQTCKVYQLSSGELLLSVSFDVGLTSVALGPAETRVFCGTASGSVLSFSLTEPPRSLEQHVPTAAAAALTGHTGRVTCLAVTRDGRTLVSGSDDQTVRLWHVASGQCVRTLPQRGAVTNVALVGWPAALRDAGAAPPPLHVGQLQRAQPDSGPLELELVLRDRPALLESPADGEDADGEGDGGRADRDDTIEQLRRQIAACEDVNASMYQFMVDKVMKV
ncbi:WD repeat-containing protein 18-like [Amphibalanus amphitrite]|uniref:WD repeat-containing protein 18-like n=1 Tax=Amphibalanus amphitrite TaxID=1232801 RepID=UPI001C90152D|nr:WD repeat-containing protein 18-like [Amphibalanus amphitrite]XP_043233806.1 WD repeat-containing protein 18-like [Amphibalanus amphitrite]XP_043233807.1 WD repeat-containing protein 18-like [Amphibalanus amphitrite]XP_043233808.1 WD repeat-containing protein 18-like [Amphibalanus amphitrite]